MTAEPNLALLAGQDEPVRRFFLHAIPAGSAPPDGARLMMSGSIKVGVWLPFRAEQSLDGRSFVSRAKVGPLPAAFSVGWWFGTPRYAPFFRAELESVTG